MSERQPTRAELIERIRTSSKDEVVLAEMQRLGFWPTGTDKPTPEAALIAREAELVKALDTLRSELGVLQDPQAALRAMRQQRMAEARERREATAQAREARRHERALHWHGERERQVPYLGAGVSAGLGPAESSGATRPERLARHGLPVLDTPLALAEAMGLPLAELKFLAFHREVARTSHYRRFALPKKTGGERVISAPMPRLKRAQYWVLDQLLAKVGCHPAAHGFLPGRSIVTNAAPHCARAVVINLDLKDFFPSIAFPRIKGVFAGLGYSEAVATLLALLCSENVADELSVDGERFFVGGAARARVLPQGAPTSPMLTNILCRSLDRRLDGAARKLGFAYTRYADDLTFSAPGPDAARDGRLLRQVHFILKAEGFTPHPAKQHVMRAGRRQEVTGVVVNGETPSVPRDERRRLRAALHRARTQGVEQSTWQGAPATRSALLGWAQFAHMVNARQGAALLAQARALPAATGVAAPRRAPPVFRQQAARGEAPPRTQGPWWQPMPRPAPQLQLTAGQIKQARLERQQARRAAQHPAAEALHANAGSAAPDATAAATAQGGAQKPPVPWVTFGIQAGLMMLLAMVLGNAALLVIFSCWLGIRLWLRRFGWPSYGVALVLITWGLLTATG